MIKLPTDVYPRVYIDEVKRLNSLPYEWITYRKVDDKHFRGTFHTKTPLADICKDGADIAGLFVFKEWLREGPKIARVTVEQYAALAQVEVRMELRDFTMPYPTLLVELPAGLKHTCVLLHLQPDTLMGHCVSSDHSNDIATLILHHDGQLLDANLDNFDSSCDGLAEETLRSLRVACNMALAMVNFGYQAEYIFAKASERDVQLSKERSERGAKAAARVKESPQLLSLLHSVKLYHKESGDSGRSGCEVGWHWRRGHWMMQAHGPHHSLRKRMYRMPVVVREDLMPADAADVITAYRS